MLPTSKDNIGNYTACESAFLHSYLNSVLTPIMQLFNTQRKFSPVTSDQIK